MGVVKNVLWIGLFILSSLLKVMSLLFLNFSHWTELQRVLSFRTLVQWKAHHFFGLNFMMELY